MVGLFSSHANKLRTAHRHVSDDSNRGQPQATRSGKRKSQPRLSDQKVSEIVAEYEAGKTVYELATTCNCHRVTISAVLKRQGVPLRCTSPTSEQIDEMVRLYESGLSLAKVGQRFAMNASTVLAQLRKMGVRTRDAQGRDR